MAALIPIAGIAGALGRARRALAERPITVSAATGAAAIAVILAIAGVVPMLGDDRSPSVRDRATATSPTTSRPTSTAPPETASAAVPSTTAGVPPAPAAETTAPPPPAPTPTATTTCRILDVAGAVVPAAAGQLGSLVGTTVSVDGATVVAAPGPSGLWADCGGRVWIQLPALLLGSVSLTPGQRISVGAVVAPHGAGYAASQGVAAPDDAAEIDAAGLHLEALGTPTVVG